MNDLPDASDHTDNTDADRHDQVDRLGRTAGAALRRPAPADGMRRLHTARRRQQLTRVAAAGATALVFAAGAFVLTRPDDEQITSATTPVTTEAPATTTVASTPTSIPVPTPTEPTTVPETVAPTTVAPTTDPAPQPPAGPGEVSAELASWAQQQRDANRPILTRSPGRGTDAAIYVAENRDPASGQFLPEGALDASYASTILLPDGRLAPLPDGIASTGTPSIRLVGLGDRVAALPLSNGSAPLSDPDLFVLDATSLTWSSIDLGWAANTDLFVDAWSVDGSVVVGRSGWLESDSGAEPAPGTDGVIVRPDLSVVTMATPPEGVQASWTSAAGDLALSFGWAGTGSAFSYPPTPNPWALDVTANEWLDVPNPDWMECEGCNWAQPTEGGVPFLEVGTDRGALVRVPDGTIGLFDTETRTWTRMDDAPIELPVPVTAQVGDLVVVAPREFAPSDQLGTLGVLDLVSGSWTTRPFDVAQPGNTWDVRTAGDAVLVQAIEAVDSVASLGVVDLDAAAVLDASGVWRAAVADEAAAWVPLAEMIDLRVATVG